jgi:hypothetical protein
MKVKIGGYPNRLICNIHSNHMNKKYGIVDWPDNQDYEDHVIEVIEDGVQRVYDVFNWIWFDRRTQKVKVKIDRWDTWSMDSTLAPIILPMLVQLKATKHGAPWVDMEDAPKELRATKAQQNKYANAGDVDPKHFERWDWVMDEMIWAFEQKCRDDWQDDYYGDYVEDQKNGPMAGSFEWIDRDGMNAHQERMTNGFKLFGKYFENLWD